MAPAVRPSAARARALKMRTRLVAWTVGFLLARRALRAAAPRAAAAAGDSLRGSSGATAAALPLPLPLPLGAGAAGAAAGACPSGAAWAAGATAGAAGAVVVVLV